MDETKTVRVALGLPWYNGADRDCIAQFLTFQHYLGRLQERLHWINCSQTTLLEKSLPKLDPVNRTGLSEITAALRGVQFEFGICEEVGCSLPGMARERIVDASLKWGADYILFYDDDMMFGTDLFLRLYLAQKPVCAALAFTARKPITPVIYSFVKRFDEEKQRDVTDVQPIFEYERNALQRVQAVGTGVVLIDTKVFQKMPKPWFHSPGLGEDIFFCYQCGEHGVEVWVDTSAKTIHKPNFQETWHDELAYDAQNEKVRRIVESQGHHDSDTDLQQLPAVV